MIQTQEHLEIKTCQWHQDKSCLLKHPEEAKGKSTHGMMNRLRNLDQQIDDMKVKTKKKPFRWRFFLLFKSIQVTAPWSDLWLLPTSNTLHPFILQCFPFHSPLTQNDWCRWCPLWTRFCSWFLTLPTVAKNLLTENHSFFGGVLSITWCHKVFLLCKLALYEHNKFEIEPFIFLPQNQYLFCFSCCYKCVEKI